MLENDKCAVPCRFSYDDGNVSGLSMKGLIFGDLDLHSAYRHGRDGDDGDRPCDPRKRAKMGEGEGLRLSKECMLIRLCL